MSDWAVIENGVVVNTITADSQAIAEEATGKTCIEYTLDNPVNIGYTWDGAEFSAPTE